MTLLEAAELVKEIETTFGVDARCEASLVPWTVPAVLQLPSPTAAW